MCSDVVDSLANSFRQLFGSNPSVFRAPGRVNLIGEHTDYNDGFVMPAAIDFYTRVAIAKRSDRRLRIHSKYFNEGGDFSLDALATQPKKHWSNYVLGVAAGLQESGYRVTGADILIESDVPLGAGLSSSAALEVSTALAMVSTSGIELEGAALAKLCQRAENEFAGTRCGIMDQFISTFGRESHALFLDCRSLEYELLPISDNLQIVICNSMVKHEHSGGEYNQRRADCEAALKALQPSLTEIKALRDVTLEDLQEHRTALTPRVYKRCRHVISENDRVVSAAKALRTGDSLEFGRLMYESHDSLRYDYEVSCKELDVLVDIASKCKGVFGGRMTGGGFGGCTVNLVASDAVEEFRRFTTDAYRRVTGISAAIYACKAAQGAGRVVLVEGGDA
jgi:galactokinase